MNARERVTLALNHQEADRVPLDLGGSNVTSMHVSVVYKLRQALGLDAPGTPVKVIEPYQMLGETDGDLLDALGTDIVPLRARNTMLGFRNEGWKPWTTFDGTPVLVPEGFNTEPEPNGDLLQELPYGTPDQVRRQVRERLKIFDPGGGYVFNTVHNVQPGAPIENVLAMYETVREYGRYL